jgi:DNA replication protein DnaC
MIDFAALVAHLPAVDPADLERDVAERERRREQRQRAERIAAASAAPVPQTVAEAIADDALQSTQALEVVRKWTDARQAGRGKPTLVLLGGAGCGKTTAAAYVLSRTKGARYVKMREVCNLFRAGFGDDAAAFDALIRCPLLVVDELATERDADLGRAALQEVVDERQARNRPTVLIANKTRAEVAERYDARTIDRLREGATAVELAATSMRRGTW